MATLQFKQDGRYFGIMGTVPVEGWGLIDLFAGAGGLTLGNSKKLKHQKAAFLIEALCGERVRYLL